MRKYTFLKTRFSDSHVTGADLAELQENEFDSQTRIDFRLQEAEVARFKRALASLT